jgi:imidazoleglycerol phosphate dehydratase HisB
MSGNLTSSLQTAITSIPECLAAGYIDLSSGMLLGIKTVDSQPAEVVELLAAATADLFQGTNVKMIENIFKKARGLKENDGHHYFQEFIVNSDNLIHVFIRGKNEEHVACFVCRKSANLGMALTKARSSMPALEAAV